MIRRRLHLLVIPIAATIAVLPLLANGCSCGHDIDFHLLSWLEAARQFSAGNLHPHWAFTPAYNAGEPRFIFYPPLSWTIGALLTLLSQHLPHISPDQAFALVPIVFTWIALCSAGLAVHALARRYTTPVAALITATLYLSNPYTLFTAYERSAYAELLAAAWIPLLLLAILPSATPHSISPSSPSASKDPPTSVPFLALAVALLWLTNAPAAVMGCYALALVAALQLAHLYWRTRSFRALLEPAAQFFAGASLGLALAAFYILPAAFERRWVEIAMATVPGMRPSDNTLFHHTGDAFHDAVLHTASTLAILLLCLTAVALLYTGIVVKREQASAPAAEPMHACRAQPHRSPTPLLPLLSILTAVVALLLTPLAAPLWRYLPEFAFLQFPWRILALLAAVLALALALALKSLPLRTPLAIALALLLPAALTYGAYGNFRQFCEPEDTPEAQFALFHATAGAEPTDEYTPVTADNDSLQHANPPFCLLPAASDPDSPCPPGPIPGQAPHHLDLDLSSSQELVLNLRDYPAWRVHRNGIPIPDRIERDDGLIAFPLPAGHSHIDVIDTVTPDQTAGDAISAVALCIFAPAAWLSLRRRRRAPPSHLPRMP